MTEYVSNTYYLYGIITSLTGVSSPPSRCRITNYRYPPEVKSYLITVGSGTGTPETMLKSFLPLWSSITRRSHTWGLVPTPPLASLGWYFPTTLWQLCRTPTLGMITPGGGFFLPYNLPWSLLISVCTIMLLRCINPTPTPLHKLRVAHLGWQGNFHLGAIFP